MKSSDSKGSSKKKEEKEKKKSSRVEKKKGEEAVKISKDKASPQKKSGSDSKKKGEEAVKKSKNKASSGKKTESGSKEPTKVISKYRRVQQILSRYCKDNGIRLSKKFNFHASNIYKGVPDMEIEEIESKIEELYLVYVKSKEVTKRFPDDFPFYDFANYLISDPTYDAVEIGVYFDDGKEKYDFKGDAMAVLGYYNDNMHHYFRAYYDKSPVAWFNISDTDGKTMVNYDITVGTSRTEEEAPTEEWDVPSEKPVPTDSEPEKTSQKGTTDNDVAIAKAKAEEEKAKAESRKAEAVISALEKLDKKTITPEQFNAIIKALE